MNVLVTGGAGFIGSHVAEALVARGHPVVVVDDLSSGRRENVPDGADFVLGDIRDDALLERVFTTYRPRWVNHHAAQTSVVRSAAAPLIDAEINILGTLRLLEVCARHSVEYFVLASTGGAMYGDIPDGQRASADTCPSAPISPYGCSKLAAEIYVRASGLPASILRYANVYGPRQDPHGEAGVIAIFCERLRRGEPLTIYARHAPGDVGCVRDYVFVDDVVRANLAAHDGQLSNATLDVGTGVGTSTRALAEALRGRLDARSPLEDAGPRPGDVGRSVLDPREFNATLGPLTPLARGLDETVAWFRAGAATPTTTSTSTTARS